MIYSDERLDEFEIEDLTDNQKRYRNCELRISELQERLEELRESRATAVDRMDEQGFDGDFDPIAPLRQAIDEAEMLIGAYENRMVEELESSFNDEEMALHRQLEERMWSAARARADDRHTRRQESGGGDG